MDCAAEKIRGTVDSECTKGLRISMRFLGAVLAVAGFCAAAVAEESRDLVSMRLVSGHQQGTGAFTVGLHLQIRPGWHVYWKYPGDAGIATSVRWTVPEGFAVSELMWPVPTRFVQAGDIEGIGYEDEVVLLARVTPPADWREPVTIRAEARWLACESTCVPGKDTAELSITPAESASPGERQMIEQWLGRVPVDTGRPDTQARITVEQSGYDYRIAMSGPAVQQLQSFVAPADGLTIEANEVAGRSVHVILRPLAGAKPPTQPSEAVIAWDEAGARCAVSVKLARP